MNNFLNGKKTYIGAVGYILAALGGLLLNYTNPEDQMALTVTSGATIFFKGLTAIGVGHKLQKICAQVFEFINKTK